MVPNAAPLTRVGAALRLGAALLAVVLAVEARAQTQLCHELEEQLASVDAVEPTAQSPEADALRAAQEEADALGCGFALTGQNMAECGALNAAIGDLQERVAASRRDGSGVREQILASLSINGCTRGRNPDTLLSADEGVDNSALITRIFGGEIVPKAGDGSPTHIVVAPPGFAAAGTGAQAFCVRVCDGYVFPLSRPASALSGRRDQESCEAACPATETQLYLSRPGGGRAALVSALTGRAYSELPTADLYRQQDFRRPPDCRCATGSAAPDFEVIGTGSAAAEPQMPSLRVEAPEGDGLLPREPAEEIGGATPDSGPARRRIRQVGPAFLPDPSGEAAPPARDPTAAP